MNCLVKQDLEVYRPSTMGDVSPVSVDIGEEVKLFVQANPIPSIVVGVAVGYLIYLLFKSK